MKIQIGRRRDIATSLLPWFLLMLAGCNIPRNQGFTIGVPYRAQEDFNFCVPASILMWRLYDGLPSLPQQFIFDALGGAPCTADVAAQGVNQFTGTQDVFLDVRLAPSETEVRQMIARQITSVGESRVPVMAVVGPSQNHVGIINGGKYHEDLEGRRVWDFVYFHDPARVANDFYPAADWLIFFCLAGQGHCAQVVSSSAIVGWDSYLASFGSSVWYYGQPAILNQDP